LPTYQRQRAVTSNLSDNAQRARRANCESDFRHVRTLGAPVAGLPSAGGR
jgi:hypothetical protein